MFNSLLSAMFGVDVVGSSGSLDSALIASYEKLVLDDEVSSLSQRAIEGCIVDEDTMAVEVIDEVVNGDRNFLAHEHTLEHLYTELWRPTISDRKSYDAWKVDHKTLAQEANAKARDILANHKPEPLSDDKLKAVNKAVEDAINSGQ
jgi:trimethylamine--corrinoid protein Co-methyltransferase